MLKTILVLSFSFALLAATPEVNSKAPDFTLNSLQGKAVKLSDEMKKGSVVLVVLRGYPGYQCPLCNRQVQEFIANGPAFAKAGARLLLVYPGPGDSLNMRAEEFVKDKMLPTNFTMVLDPDYKFTNLYDLRWDAPKETAYPSTFILNGSGVVTFAKVGRTHGGRTSAAELLEHLARK